MQRRVKISELKARLSAYVAAVREGDTVIVCDRRTPVAMLVPLDASEKEGFDVAEATAPLKRLRTIEPVRLRRAVDVVGLLREDRRRR